MAVARHWVFATGAVIVAGCGGAGGGGSAPLAPPPDLPPQQFEPGTSFRAITIDTGISHVFSIAGVPFRDALSDPERFGGGLAAADIDKDGLIDLYLVAGDGAPNRLYRNLGGNQFSDVAADIGLDLAHKGSGPAFADIDGDSDLDLFVGAVDGDPYFLLRNDGGQFTDITATSGIEITAENTVSAGFGDYDDDGDLDLVLAHWGNPESADTETLWQNNGDGTFVSASIASGIAGQLLAPRNGVTQSALTDYTFAPMFTDLDVDGDQDLVIAADFKTSQVFRNNGDATFDAITDRNVIIDDSGMGSAIGDYDNDGDMDWFVTAIYEDPSQPDAHIGNRLYRNLGDGTFEDVTAAAGVIDGGWGWGACMEDFDNDGDLDIFHVNGFDASSAQDFLDDRVRYFESQGDGTFVETAAAAGLTDTGQGRGVACVDFDRDGDLDIFVTNNEWQTDANVFYENTLSNDNHYLAISLAGSGLNSACVGARIEVTAGGETQVREIRAGNQYVSHGPAEVHFGLDSAETVDVTVTWPDGSTTEQSGIAANQVLIVTQREDSP